MSVVRKKKKAANVKKHSLSPMILWDLVSDSISMNTSIPRLAKLREISGACMNRVERKVVDVMSENGRAAFRDCDRFSLVTDGSCRSSKETLITVIYCDGVGKCSFLTDQQLWTAKFASLCDQIDADEEIERLLARRDQERLSAYKHLQALSHQVKLITCERLTLDSFRVDESLPLPFKPLRPGHNLVIQDGFFTVTNESGDATSVDLALLSDLPLITFVQDQGTVGASAAAFLIWIGKQVFLAHFGWDKFHRVINDMKLSVNTQFGFAQAQLASTYVFSMNYKPFGAGAGHFSRRRRQR